MGFAEESWQEEKLTVRKGKLPSVAEKSQG
jgi:hypothetical protein